MPTSPNNGNSQMDLLLELLRRSVAAPAAHTGADAPAAPPLVMPPLPVATKRLSATDLLTGWFQPESAATNPWDDYFGESFAAGGGAGAAAQAGTGELALLLQLLAGNSGTSGSPAAQAAPTRRPPSPADSPYLWIDLWDFMDQSPADVADDEAEAAVTCLYDFIHALGRRDVEGAMNCVAPHYHVFENEQETDRLGLRHQMESMLDSLRDWVLDVALLEVPRPISHPNGILIDANIQIHATHIADDLRRLITYHRMAVLEQQSYYDWKITALSPLE